MKRSMVVAVAVAVAVVLGGAAFAGGSRAEAHPLGNLTVNTSARILVAPDTVTVDYVLDLAEIPTVQERHDIEAAGSLAAYARSTCTSLMSGVHIEVDGAPRTLGVNSATAAYVPGQAGLRTLRVECRFVSAGQVAAGVLTWRDTNHVERIGWREVIVQGDLMTVLSDVPAISPSDYLRAYPDDVPPPRDLEATVEVGRGGAPLANGAPASQPGDVQARGADGLTGAFNRLVGERELTVGVGAIAAALALLLGALHSLAPGHGKTLMAGMVATRRGSMRQVVAIGSTVAVTHTVGVVVLGVVVSTSQAVAPERVLSWLTIATGAVVLAMGGWMLVRRVRHGVPAHGHHHHHMFAARGHRHRHHHHHHGHGHHDHHAHDHHHAHGHDHHHDHDPRTPRPRSVALLGVVGGLVPTPSALLVLLGAAALGRAWFGVFLVVVYGVGMAFTLVGAGMLLVRLQGWLERQYAQARWFVLGMRTLPVITALALIVAGGSLALRGAVAI